jgi:O-antigen/teichoic acid export membrane protein
MIKNLKQDIFLKNYIIYFIGSIVMAVLNYALHPILGRFLSPTDFGDFQVFIALVSQTTIFFGAVSIISVNIIANAENPQQRNKILAELQKITFLITFFLIICLLFLIPKIQNFFNLSNIYPLIGLIIILLISALIVFRNAYLQGSGQFLALSLSGIMVSLGKLIFAVLLILIGWGTVGATLGIILSNIVLLIYLIFKTKKDIPIFVKSNIHVLEKGDIKKQLQYGVLVIFATGIATLFYTIDVLIVKRNFSPDEAGLYIGISVIAKILLFAIGPISAVLLSSIKIKNTFKENFSIFKKSLGIALIVGFSGMITFFLFYDLIVVVMIGSKYADVAYLLPKVGLLMFLTALMNIFIYYFLALRRFFLIFISLFGTAVLGFIMFQSYTSITDVLNNLLVALIFINLSLVFLYAKDYFNYRSGI